MGCEGEFWPILPKKEQVKGDVLTHPVLQESSEPGSPIEVPKPMVQYLNEYHPVFKTKGLQKASGSRPGPSPFLDGLGHGTQFRPGLARRAGPPVGPPLKIYIYIYKIFKK